MSHLESSNDEQAVNGSVRADLLRNSSGCKRLQQAPLLRPLLDSIPAIVFLKDTENRLITVNQQFSHFFQCSAEGVEGEMMTTIVGDELGDQCYESDLIVMQSKEPIGQVCRGVNSAGERVILQCQKFPVLNQFGHVEKILAFAYETPIESEIFDGACDESSLSRVMFESTTDAAVIFNATENRLVRANPAAQQLFRGLDLSQLLIDPPIEVRQLLTDNSEGCNIVSGFHLRPHLQAALEKKHLRFDWVFEDAKGDDIVADVVITCFEAGEVRYLLMIVRDETDIRKNAAKLDDLNQKLQASTQQAGMNEITNGVLHNVKNVINSINVSATLIRERIDASNVGTLKKVSTLIDAQKDNIGQFFENDSRGKSFPEFLRKLTHVFESDQLKLKSETTELLKSVDHVKQVISAQQSSARQSVSFEVIDVIDLVEDALKINETQLKDLQVDVVKNWENVGKIPLDRHVTLQVLVNLMKNAKQAMESVSVPEKTMTLDVHSSGDQVVIAVSDSGVGISEENLSHIFEHGFTTKADGHGFGLHSCKQAVERLGGRISVSSEGEGCGASFVLHLPKKGAKGGVICHDRG